MDSITLIREQLRGAHNYLETTIDDATPEQLHWIPPGTATPLGATYIHVVQSEDAIVNVALQQKEMVAVSWGHNLGASEPQPPAPWEEAGYMAWSRRVRIDFPKFREYARAVYAATDAYVATLKPEDLDQVVDLSAIGEEPVTLAWVLTRYVVGHADNICGEVSCLKGLQGGRGY